MKKLYFIIFLLFGFFAEQAKAQLVANDDTVYVNGGGIAMNGPNFFSVRTNDTYNGNTIGNGVVNVTQISTSSSTINLSGINVLVQSGTAVGTYTITYEICLVSNPGICDTATVTVNVCNQNAPIIAPVSCLDPEGTLTVTGLPTPGSWTLTQQRNNETPTTITGSGATYTATGLSPDGYRYRVTYDQCMSSYSDYTYLGYYNGFDADLTGVFVDFNSDGVVSIGDKINYTLSITNVIDCDITNIQVVESNISFSGFPISSLSPNQTTTRTAMYSITQSDINAGTVSQWVGISGSVNGGTTYTKAFSDVELGIPTGLRFVAFIDSNGNGVQDNGEPNFTGGQLQYELNDNGFPIYASSNTGEIIIYETNQANTYNVSYAVYTACEGALTVNPSVYEDISVDGADFTTYYFPITTQTCQDVAVYLSPGSNPRPNLPYLQYISYANYGTEILALGTITFIADPNVTVTSVSIPGAVITADGFTYNFSDLQPGDYQYFYVTLQVANVPVVNLGDILTNTVSITTPAGDANPSNNTNILNSVVTNSYDPNDMTEIHGPRILHETFNPEEYLQYTVRFENTGNADALDIEVLTYVDDKVDLTTMRMIGASHDYSMAHDGAFIYVTFNDINLSPSVGETNIGKGYFTFEAKLLPGIEVGDVVYADAEIFFDSNPGIMTNPCLTEFVDQLSTGEVSIAKTLVWPNPSSGLINVQSAAVIENVRMGDISGKTILQQQGNTNDMMIDISGLSKGIYFLTVSGNGASKTVKVIKE